MENYFDIPSQVVLALLNAKEVTSVQIETENDQGMSAANAHIAYVSDANDPRHFDLSLDQLYETSEVLKSVGITEDSNENIQDRLKSIEQILRATINGLNDTQEVGFVQQDIPVWNLQPYCRDWDLHDAPAAPAPQDL